MATLKRRGSPVAPDVRSIPLAQVLSGPRPGRTDPEADQLWRSLRAEVDAACVDTEFDLRVGLRLTGHHHAEWRARRAAWVHQRFSSDPRVLVG